MRSKNNKETGFIPVKERRALATFAVRRSGRSSPVPSSNEDEDRGAEPSEEERSLEEVIPPAKKVKSSEGGIEIDGQREDYSTNSSPQKRATMCSEDVVDSQPSKKAKTSADEEMICSICNIAKNRLDCFSKNQRKSGGNSKCKDCTGYVSTVQKSKAYAEMEEKKYNSIKKVYEGGLKKLKEENIDFEKEMNKRTDYLYMVTSVSAVGDPFSPVLHGIYTTCKKAQDAARRAFEKVSDTYRNGAFVPNGKRISKCDLSEFLVPARKTSTSRLLYEAFTEPQDDCCQYTAVAVSSTQMVDGTASGCDLPSMGSYFLSDLFDPKYVKNSDEDRPEQNGESRKNRSEITKVYAIFDHYFGNMGGSDNDINMSGVYSNKDDAFDAALRLSHFDDEEEEKKQIEEAKGKHRGMLYGDENYCWAVGMESVVLDVHLDEMVELTNCSGVWMNPSLTWE